MASFEPQDFGLDEPPPRPTTPPLRRGFLVVLFLLCTLALMVYGIPYTAERAGYAWEAGRARAASEALARLDKAGIVNRASALFRLATTAVAPAVVRVETRRFAGNGGNGQPPGGGPGGLEGSSLGSGVIIDKPHGYIVTNFHVIKNADRIMVRLSQGTMLPATVVGSDPKTDLAVLRVKGEVPFAASWGDSDKLDIGDWVLAIGSPFALDHTVTAGIVSATQRDDLKINEYESFIQTDAAINPGNSGGPLIDLTGKVIGINTAIFSSNQSQGNEGIGLAIPSSMARRVAESLIKEGRVVRGYLGVRIEPVTEPIAKNLSLPTARGALIRELTGDSPAGKAGLKEGDVIVSLAGKDVADTAALRNLTADLEIGKTVPVGYFRDGKLRTASVTIAEFPSTPVLASFGFRVREVPPKEAEGASGVLEIDQIVQGSPAARVGLKPGMRILAIGRTPVHNKAEYDAALSALPHGNGLTLLIQTAEGQTGTVTIGSQPRLP